MPRALQLHVVGAPLEITSDYSRPVPQAGEVLVRTHAIALNPIDYKQMKLGVFLTKFPVVLGRDYAGVVEEVGEGVEKWKVGDRVFGYPSQQSGTFSEYALSPAFLVAKIPDDISFEQAASINLGAMTSFVSLYHSLKLPRPQEHKVFDQPEYVLIWGGASSVGSYGIQLARASGLTVITTASPRQHAYLTSLGATHVLDYSDPDIVSKIREISGGRLRYVFDTISAETAETAAKALTTEEETYLVYISGDPKVRPNVKLIMTFAQVVLSNPEFGASSYAELGKLIHEGVVIPNRIEVIPGGLNGIQEGLARLEKGVSGVKLVVKLE